MNGSRSGPPGGQDEPSDPAVGRAARPARPAGSSPAGAHPIGGIGAVIFDFLGTLTVAASAAERDRGHHRVAAVFGIPVQRFRAVLRETWSERAVGAYGDLPATLRMVAERCGVHPSDRTVATACAVRRDEQRDYIRPRPEAARVLAILAAAGYPIGVVSDRTHEVPEAWPTLPFARSVTTTLFSVEIGTKKPDPAIFRLAADRLGLPPTRCLYVGDGDSRELPGAGAVGMHPVRLLTPDHAGAHVIDPVEWDGPTIGSLEDVLSLLGLPHDPSHQP